MPASFVTLCLDPTVPLPSVQHILGVCHKPYPNFAPLVFAFTSLSAYDAWRHYRRARAEHPTLSPYELIDHRLHRRPLDMRLIPLAAAHDDLGASECRGAQRFAAPADARESRAVCTYTEQHRE
ncbi:hypothetical protein B0H11DRAFT_2219517 [Mycena galericulata]|nr:hypothetical protein B0H11DRAFT_2219517 [Mycena galericulata]